MQQPQQPFGYQQFVPQVEKEQQHGPRPTSPAATTDATLALAPKPPPSLPTAKSPRKAEFAQVADDVDQKASTSAAVEEKVKGSPKEVAIIQVIPIITPPVEQAPIEEVILEIKLDKSDLTTRKDSVPSSSVGQNIASNAIPTVVSLENEFQRLSAMHSLGIIEGGERKFLILLF